MGTGYFIRHPHITARIWDRNFDCFTIFLCQRETKKLLQVGPVWCYNKQWLLFLLPCSWPVLMVLTTAASPITVLPCPASPSVCQEHTFHNKSGLSCWWSRQFSMFQDLIWEPRRCPFSPHSWLFVGFTFLKKKVVCLAATVSHEKWMKSQCFMLPAASPHL